MFQKITQSELDARLADHKLWLDSKQQKGTTFSGYNICFDGLNFNSADLIGGNLVSCSFLHADLSSCNAESINLSESDFSGCNLSGANLRRTDMKYCEVDEHTNFEGTVAEGAIVDMHLFQKLPPQIQQSNLQVVDKNMIVIQMTFEEGDMVEKHIAEDLTSLFTDTMRQKYHIEDTNISFSSNRVICNIKAQNEAIRDAVNKDRKLFATYLQTQGKEVLEQFTNGDRVLHNMMLWRLERLVADKGMFQVLADERRMQIVDKQLEQAALQNLKIDLLTEIATLKDTTDILKDMVHNFQNALMVGVPTTTVAIEQKTSVHVILTNNDIVEIAVKDIQYIELDISVIKIYKIAENEPILLRKGAVFTDLANRITDIDNYTILVHRTYILNLREMSGSPIPMSGNKIVVVKRPNGETKQIIIGRNHVQRFDELSKAL